MLEAFAAETRDWWSPVHLVMAGPDGDGSGRALRAQAERLGIGGRVTWAGMLDGDAKWGALRAAEAVGLPSPQENVAIAVVEALACGTPALISDQVNIWREVVEDGGGLAAPDTAEGTRRLLQQWRAESADAVAWAKRGLRARASFLRRFEGLAAARRLAGEIQGALAAD